MTVDDAGGETARAGPVAGQRLKAAREAQKREPADIAQELHIDLATLDALEHNRFAELGAPVFAKGHLKKYAEALGIPVDDVIADYYALQESSELPPVVAERTSVRHSVHVPPWFYALALALLVLAVLVFWFTRPAELPPADPPQPAIEATDSDAGDAAGTRERLPRETDPVEPLAAAATSPTSADDPAPGVVREEPAAAPVAAPSEELTLTIVYTGECWTEVRDASGRRLYSGTGSIGDRRTLRGRPPLAVVLGNHNAATLTVNGESYAVPRGSTRGNMARFRIEAT